MGSNAKLCPRAPNCSVTPLEAAVLFFSLFSCPFDFVRIYDGASNASEAIGSYCGRWTDVSVYSTGESMYVEFVTKSGRNEAFVRPSTWSDSGSVTVGVQRRGFKARFDITDRFVDLGTSRARHLPGRLVGPPAMWAAMLKYRSNDIPLDREWYERGREGSTEQSQRGGDQGRREWKREAGQGPLAKEGGLYLDIFVAPPPRVSSYATVRGAGLPTQPGPV